MNRDARQVLTEWLVLGAQRGDTRAFTELYKLWACDLRRLAAVQLKQSESAEEVAQDAWIAIAKGLHRLEDPACFPRWAFRIVDRRCIDWIRRRQTDRRRVEELAGTQVEWAPEGSVPDSPEVVALRESIARLSPDARKLIHLFYDVGLSIAELAEILDLPPGTVKSRLFTTREHLKQLLERMKS